MSKDKEIKKSITTISNSFPLRFLFEETSIAFILNLYFVKYFNEPKLTNIGINKPLQ